MEFVNGDPTWYPYREVLQEIDSDSDDGTIVISSDDTESDTLSESSEVSAISSLDYSEVVSGWSCSYSDVSSKSWSDKTSHASFDYNAWSDAESINSLAECNFIECTVALSNARRAIILNEFDHTGQLPETILGLCLLPLDTEGDLYSVFTELQSETDGLHTHLDSDDCQMFATAGKDYLTTLYDKPVCPSNWPVRLFNYCLPCVYLPARSNTVLREQLRFLASPGQLDLVHFIKSVHKSVRTDPRITHSLMLFMLEGGAYNFKLTMRFHAMFDSSRSYCKDMELFVFNKDMREASYEMHYGFLDSMIDCYVQDHASPESPASEE